MVEEYLLQCTYYIAMVPPYSWVELRDGPFYTGLLYLNPKTKRYPTLIWSFLVSVKGIFGFGCCLGFGHWSSLCVPPFPFWIGVFLLLNLLLFLFYSIACALLVARPTRLFQALLSCRPLCWVWRNSHSIPSDGFFFPWLHLASWLKMCAFLRFSNSQISTPKKSKITRFPIGFQHVTKIKCEGFLKVCNFIPDLQPNLGKSSCGWLRVSLHHKIGKRKEPWCAQVCGLGKIFLTSKFSYSLFSNPTHKSKLRLLQGTHTVHRQVQGWFFLGLRTVVLAQSHLLV